MSNEHDAAIKKTIETLYTEPEPSAALDKTVIRTGARVTRIDEEGYVVAVVLLVVDCDRDEVAEAGRPGLHRAVGHLERERDVVGVEEQADEIPPRNGA